MNEQNREGLFTLQDQRSDTKTMKPSFRMSKKIITRSDAIPSLKIGPQRFHYLYSAVLPQVHLTLVSVLQGIAFGILLINIPLPYNTSVSFSFEFFLQQYFYLPYLMGSLGILIIWKQFMYASMFRNWPASTTQIILIYMLAVAEIIAFRVLAAASTKVPLSATVPTWLIAVAFVTIFGGSIRLNDLRLEKIEDFENSQVGRISREGDFYNGMCLVSAGIILVLLAVLYNWLIDIAKGVIHDVSIIPWIVYASLFIMTCLILQLDTAHRRSFIRELVKGSDLVVSRYGVIRYETQDEVKKETEEVLASQRKTDNKQTFRDEVIETQAHHLFADKFYRFSCFSLLGVITGGVVALFLFRDILKRRNY